MDENECQGVEKMFREALQALALSSSEQIRVAVPGCVICEIYEDFIGMYSSFIECFRIVSDDSQKQEITVIFDFLETMSDENFVCFDESLLENENWTEVRKLAASALKELNWELQSPSEYIETETGIWRRTD